MAISGFTRQVWLSLFPFGNTFKIAISTILSVATLTPVVSRSKKQIGFFKLSSIVLICCAKILFIEVLMELIKKKRGFCFQNPLLHYNICEIKFLCSRPKLPNNQRRALRIVRPKHRLPLCGRNCAKGTFYGE